MTPKLAKEMDIKFTLIHQKKLGQLTKLLNLILVFVIYSSSFQLLFSTIGIFGSIFGLCGLEFGIFGAS
jgi:hypothetical protein